MLAKTVQRQRGSGNSSEEPAAPANYMVVRSFQLFMQRRLQTVPTPLGKCTRPSDISHSLGGPPQVQHRMSISPTGQNTAPPSEVSEWAR